MRGITVARRMRRFILAAGLSPFAADREVDA
jgi:hypothetical protein